MDAPAKGWHRENYILLAAMLAALVVFALDFVTLDGIAHGMLYLPCILVAGLLRRQRSVVLITMLSAALLLAYIPLMDAPASSHMWRIVIGNRLLSLVLLVVTAMATLRFIRLLAVRDAALAANQRSRRELEDEQALRQIACEAGVIGGWTVDLETLQIHMSDEAAAIQGLPAGTQPSLEEGIAVYSPQDQPRLRELFERCAQDGVPFDDEFVLLAGEHRVCVRAMGRAVRAEDGRIVRVQGGLQDISVRKQLEDTVAAGHRKFTQVADSLPLFVWSATPEGRVDYVSQQVADYTGINPGNILTGEGLRTLMHPDDWVPFKQAWADSVATATPFHIEFRKRHHSGEYRWHVSQAQPIRNEAGRIERWVGSRLDIEDRKRIEQQASALSERLTTTLESIAEGFILLDPQWRYAFVNTRAEHLLGRSRETLLGQVIWDAYPLTIGTIVETEYRRAMASGASVSFVSFYPPLAMWVEVHAHPSREGLAVYFRDITAKRNAEAQLRLLETAISRINDIVLITEANPINEPGPRIVFANQAFERQMGYAPEDVIGKSPRMLQGADTSAEQRAHIREALARGAPVRAQLTNYTRSGERVELELDIAPLHDEDGQLTHYVSVERNVTERAALDARLQQAQRMESVGQLTGGLAHDFNNLLTVILGNAEILVEELPAGDRLQDVAQMVADASDRAATLVQRLLAFARQQTLEPHAVDVAALVEGMKALLRRSLGEHVELHVESAHDLPPALADPSQLESALLNLCINARDAMPAGGKLNIRLSATGASNIQTAAEGVPAGDYVALEVSDTGSGIAPEDLPRVFEPFFTTKERSGGSGLGLSMVYGFARQSHGHVAIHSTPRVGTQVTLFLPVASTHPAPRTAAVAPAPANLATGGSARILLVEDNDLVRTFACSQLQALGYEVLAAEHGAAALALLEAGERVDLLFTDVVMPGGLSGIELAHQVRARWPRMPILLTSGFAEDEQATLANGPYPVLEKPYRPQHLAERIHALLGWAP